MYKLGANRINLWDEPFMQKLEMTMELKVLYLYLLSNALSNIAGVYKITDRRILFDLCNPNLNLPALFLQLKKMKKVYRCGSYVIIKDAPLYIKKMTKTVIKEMDSIIYELPDKIKTKMKKIHYRYAHLYGEPLLEELMALGKEKKMVSCSLPKNKDMNEGLFDGTFIQGREHEKSKNNHQNDRASVFNSSGLFQGVESTKTNTADEQNNSEARSFITKEATRKNVRVENKPRIEAFSSIQTPPVETSPVEITPAVEPILEEETAELKQQNTGACSILDDETAELEQQKPEASSILEEETAELEQQKPEASSVLDDETVELEAHYTDEALTEKLTAENLTEEDKQIIKRIRESDAFYSNFAKDAREFAAKQRRLEILENMHNIQRANKLPSPPVKTLRVDEASPSVQTPLNEEPSVKPSVSVETLTQPSSSVQTPTVDKTPPITQTPSIDAPPVKTPLTVETPPIDAPPVKTSSIAKTLSESHTESYTGELGLTFGQNYKTPSQNSKGQEIGLIQRNVNTKTPSNQNANNAKRRQEVERFQEKYAQSVYKQFQKAGLYQGIDYLYFYKCDFKRGLKTLQERAITVEDLKDAYSLNEVIEAYLEKAKAEKDERVRCTMAFYKMCDAREYNTLNVVNY